MFLEWLLIVFSVSEQYNDFTMKSGRFWRLFVVFCVLLAIGATFIHAKKSKNTVAYSQAPQSVLGTSTPANTPPQALLSTQLYVPQSFNNCGPAALSMDLSFYGVAVSQEVLADALRPDHNSTGKNDDKSTFPDQIAAQAEQYNGLIAYYRPAGSVALLKQLVAAGFPVIVRTLFMNNDQVAHYRVVKGYDDATGQIIEEDGFQGPNVTYSYGDFNALWKYFNYDYIVLAKPAQKAQVEAIIGADVNAATAWQDAANIAKKDLAASPSDYLATFNLAVADYYLGNYSQTVSLYQSVASQLPKNTLWYQIEPIEAEYQLGNYDAVYSMTQAIFDAGNIAFPELYVLRGQAYEKQGNDTQARAEFNTALMYNANLQSAKDALAALGSK